MANVWVHYKQESHQVPRGTSLAALIKEVRAVQPELRSSQVRSPPSGGDVCVCACVPWGSHSGRLRRLDSMQLTFVHANLGYRITDENLAALAPDTRLIANEENEEGTCTAGSASNSRCPMGSPVLLAADSWLPNGWLPN